MILGVVYLLSRSFLITSIASAISVKISVSAAVGSMSGTSQSKMARYFSTRCLTSRARSPRCASISSCSILGKRVTPQLEQFGRGQVRKIGDDFTDNSGIGQLVMGLEIGA